MNSGSAVTKSGASTQERQAIIKRLQAHNRGDRSRSDPHWQLNELSNVEKHRLPHAATLNNLSTPTFFAPYNIDVDEIHVLTASFDSGAPIAEYPAFDSTGAEVNMHFTTAFDVAFSKGAPQRLWGSSIPKTLKAIHGHTIDKVLPPLTPFLNQP